MSACLKLCMKRKCLQNYRRSWSRGCWKGLSIRSLIAVDLCCSVNWAVWVRIPPNFNLLCTSQSDYSVNQVKFLMKHGRTLETRYCLEIHFYLSFFSMMNKFCQPNWWTRHRIWNFTILSLPPPHPSLLYSWFQTNNNNFKFKNRGYWFKPHPSCGFELASCHWACSSF